MADLIVDLRKNYPFLDAIWARRLVRAYGTDAAIFLGDAQCAEDLGPEFGGSLTGAEVHWLMTREYAQTANFVEKVIVFGVAR